MFGRVSSTPIQKLETDPGILIVPCEALSKGPPEMKKNHLPGWSVEMGGWSVKMRSLFRVVKPGIFNSVRGVRGSYGPRRKAQLAVQPLEAGKGPGFYGG
jgi:hypothetical protein